MVLMLVVHQTLHHDTTTIHRVGMTTLVEHSSLKWHSLETEFNELFISLKPLLLRIVQNTIMVCVLRKLTLKNSTELLRRQASNQAKHHLQTRYL